MKNKRSELGKQTFWVLLEQVAKKRKILLIDKKISKSDLFHLKFTKVFYFLIDF